MEIARLVGLVLGAAWLGWTLYRHVGVYLARGRVLAVTAPVLARLIALVGVVAAMAAPSPATWSALGAAIVVARLPEGATPGGRVTGRQQRFARVTR